MKSKGKELGQADTLRLGCKQVEGQHQLSHALCSVPVLSATSAFSTDLMLMRTRVEVTARRPTGGKCFGPMAHTCSVG